jgi:hypothetical protein
VFVLDVNYDRDVKGKQWRSTETILRHCWKQCSDRFWIESSDWALTNVHIQDNQRDRTLTINGENSTWSASSSVGCWWTTIASFSCSFNIQFSYYRIIRSCSVATDPKRRAHTATQAHRDTHVYSLIKLARRFITNGTTKHIIFSLTGSSTWYARLKETKERKCRHTFSVRRVLVVLLTTEAANQHSQSGMSSKSTTHASTRSEVMI